MKKKIWERHQPCKILKVNVDGDKYVARNCKKDTKTTKNCYMFLKRKYNICECLKNLYEKKPRIMPIILCYFGLNCTDSFFKILNKIKKKLKISAPRN